MDNIKRQQAATDIQEQVKNLANLVEYQQDSVVSRMLIKKETANLTLFSFEQGQGLSEHTAPFDAFVNILDGEAEITISGRVYRLKAGEMIIMPAHKPHALKAKKRFKMLLVMIKK